MNKFFNDKFFIILFAFLFSAIVEFIVREGGGFTLTAFIFHGIYKLGMTGLILLDEDQKRQHEN